MYRRRHADAAQSARCDHESRAGRVTVPAGRDA